MFYDDERGNERHSSDNSEPRKRKRISTGNKYEKVKIGHSPDGQRERRPQYDNDRPYNKPFNNDDRNDYDRGSNPPSGSFGYNDRENFKRPHQRPLSDDYGNKRDDDYRGNRHDDNYGNRVGDPDDAFGNPYYDRPETRGGNRYNDRQGTRNNDRQGNRYGDRQGSRYGDRQGNSYGDRQGNSYGDRQGGNYGNRQGDRYNSRQGSNDRQGNSYGNRQNYRQGSRQDDRYGNKPGFTKKFDKNGSRSGFKPQAGRGTKAPMRQPIYHFDEEPDNGPIRLNKFIANSGLCSRREADEYIKAGLLTVNDIKVTELGVKVLPTDDIRYNGTRITPEKKVYILLNKPKDYVTSVDDPHAKRTVMELVKGACKERIYPVGRLDRMTTGVLLLTNDGDLTKKLTHPVSEIKKIYQVRLDKAITPEDLQSIIDGITLDDGVIKADDIGFANDTDQDLVGIEIHSGRNRIVRRIFEHLGYKVIRLDRIFFGGLTKKGLSRGQWRYLMPREVGFLKMLQV